MSAGLLLRRYDSPMGTRPLAVRMERYIVDADGCHLWQGKVKADGYGLIQNQGVELRVHRVAWEQANGPIPEGMDIDHLCHNADESCPGGVCKHRRCMNAEHLGPRTRGDNLRGGRNWHAQKTHCLHGHEYTPENTRVGTMPNGGPRRTCIACEKQRWINRKASAA